MILKKGAKGQNVERLQEDLNALSYNCGIPDGIYGAHTKNAVIAFQAVNGLKRDGIAGPKTLLSIEDQVKQPMNTGRPTSEHFSFEEFKCRDGSEVPKEYWTSLQRLMDLLEQIRVVCGNRAISITSGYRTPAYNKKCGGATYSQHMLAKAADIQVDGLTPSQVYKICDKVNPNGGVGKYASFTHVDIRGYRSRW